MSGKGEIRNPEKIGAQARTGEVDFQMMFDM